MRTYLWSKIIDLAYSVKTMKSMYLDYIHNMPEKTFLAKYISRNDFSKLSYDYLLFKTIEDKMKFKIMTIYDNRYPAKLKYSIDPPIAFYYIGDIEYLEKFSVAVVGARIAPSRYLKIARNIGYSLGKRGIIGISGLAKGIDASFHSGIEHSLGIMGCGIDIIYPAENIELYKKVIDKGILISEYPLKTKPLPWHFPRRNRLIAGLCDLLILVYAREKSGSIITMDFALDLGKDIFLTREMYERLDLAGHSIKDLKKYLKLN